MKIGIDAHTLEGNRTGAGRVLFNLINQWAKMDLPSDLESILYFKKEIPEDLPAHFKRKLLKPILGKQSTVLFMHWLLPRVAKKDRLDLLFCPNYIAPVFYNAKIALSLYDISYEAKPGEFNWPSVWDRILLKKVSKISAKKANIILTSSNFSKEEIIKYYQIKPEKVFSIPLGAEASFKRIDDLEKLKKIKDKYGIKDKFILFLGSVFDRRHLPEIIEAFAQLCLPDYQLVIRGQDYTKKGNIADLIKKTNSKLSREAVLKKDFIEQKDLPVLYNTASLFIYLSDYEGFGLPVLEAMACGLSSITSRTSSIVEVGNDAVIYVEENTNVNEIKRAIYRGLTNKDLRQNLIKKGIDQAQRFSWQKCAKETLDKLLES